MWPSELRFYVSLDTKEVTLETFFLANLWRSTEETKRYTTKANNTWRKWQKHTKSKWKSKDNTNQQLTLRIAHTCIRLLPAYSRFRASRHCRLANDRSLFSSTCSSCSRRWPTNENSPICLILLRSRTSSISSARLSRPSTFDISLPVNADEKQPLQRRVLPFSGVAVQWSGHWRCNQEVVVSTSIRSIFTQWLLRPTLSTLCQVALWPGWGLWWRLGLEFALKTLCNVNTMEHHGQHGLWQWPGAINFVSFQFFHNGLSFRMSTNSNLKPNLAPTHPAKPKPNPTNPIPNTKPNLRNSGTSE